MKKNVLVLLSILLLCATCTSHKKDKLTIATAANMQFAIKALTDAFTTETGIACETIISSSGKLTAQIKEGAPFHVFVSADMKYPADLHANGFTTGEPKIYAYGKLVLWTMLDNLDPGIEVLATERIKYIALANPKTAPYGVAALETLRHYQLFEKVEKKLVYGESISQTNQFITTTAAEIGFTSKSVVLSPEIRDLGKWKTIDPEIYAPLAQGVVLLKNNKKHLEQAQQFYNFLFSEKAREILLTFGYSVENN